MSRRFSSSFPIDPAFFVGFYAVFTAFFVPGILFEKLTTAYLAPNLGLGWWASMSLPYVAKTLLCGAAGWLLFSVVWSTGLLTVVAVARVWRHVASSVTYTPARTV